MVDDLDFAVPAYYILNQSMDEDQAQAVMWALNMTRVYCAIISDVHHAKLALSIVSEAVRTTTEAEACVLALKLWKDTGRPSLVLGTADVLDAVYADGRREVVAVTC